MAIRTLLLGHLITIATGLCGTVDLLRVLPNQAVATAVRLDAAGDIYVAGWLTPPNPKSANDAKDGFVGKFSPDGSQLLYWVVFSGSGPDSVSAVAIGSDGSAYITGTTGSSDFPTTSGAMQMSLGYNGLQAFAAKIDPGGGLTFATLLGGSAEAQGYAIAVGTGGESYITGETVYAGFPTTAGSLGSQINDPNFGSRFIVELNPAGTAALLSIRGFGGNSIVVDANGFIYIAGSIDAAMTATPGAFQATHTTEFCGGTSQLSLPCLYQYVSKIDPTGSSLVYSTYITGSFGATPAGMAVDTAGDVIVAGTTNSYDYPVTSGAFQMSYVANLPSGPPVPGTGTLFQEIVPPAASGYVTKLGPSGTGLIWSTFFSGSAADTVLGMALDETGNIDIIGLATSNDLPGISGGVPDGCKPSGLHSVPFVARISADGESAAPTDLINGLPFCANCNSNYPSYAVAARADGSLVGVAGSAYLFEGNTFAGNRLECLVDPADNSQLLSVAPGQLLTLLGNELSPAMASVNSGVTVTFDAIPAPILYSAGGQINVQVPFEVGQGLTTLQVSSPDVSLPVNESRVLAVTPTQPSLYLASSTLVASNSMVICGGSVYYGLQALALNADGSVNSCSDPAASGTQVRLFLNGVGATNPASSTGAASPNPPLSLNLAADASASQPPFTVVSTTTIPETIEAVVQITLQVPSSISSGDVSPATVSLKLGGIPTREQGVIVWIK